MPAAPSTASTLVNASTLPTTSSTRDDDRDVEDAIDPLFRSATLAAGSFASTACVKRAGACGFGARLRAAVSSRRADASADAHRGQVSKCARSALVDLEVSGGYRLDELQHVAARHVSSNSLNRFFAR